MIRRRIRQPCASVLTFVLTILLLLTACGDGNDHFRPLTVGEPAPTVSVRTLAGDSAHVGPGEPITLLNIWVTVCPECSRVLPVLERLHQDFGPRGLRVLAVSVDPSEAAVRRYLAAHHVTFTIAQDRSVGILSTYQAIGVPATFLLDRTGRLLTRQFGEFDYMAMRGSIERALAARRSP